MEKWNQAAEVTTAKLKAYVNKEEEEEEDNE
jgi:hypothetical protein